MPRGSSSHLGSLCAQEDSRDRLSFLLRHGRLSTQHTGQKGTTDCAVLGRQEEPSIITRSSDCLQQHEGPLEVQHLLARMAGFSGRQIPLANAGRKADGTRHKHPTFAEAKHTLLEQWDHDRNNKNGNFPDNTSLRSSKPIWWRCRECSKGKVHSWQASPNERIGRRVRGCPCCVGRRLCECNSLENVCPDVVADFDAEKNGISFAEVTSSTHRKYSWLLDKPGAEKRSVNQRTAYVRQKLHTINRRT